MKRVPCALILMVSLCCCVLVRADDPNSMPPAPEDPVYDGPVYFADARLKEAVELALWTWDPTPADMLGLTSLGAASWGISDLTGLEYATNLYELEVHFNSISDLSPLANLTELQRLVVNNNQVSDITPLSGLTNLTHLDVHDNHISDISALSSLTKLQTLFIRLNSIGDLSPLTQLTDLEYLDAHMTGVSDISPLSGLTKLQQLILQFNQISDLSPLSGLTELRGLNLRYNNISDVSPLLALSNLTDLSLRSNQISDISVLAEMTGLELLDLEGNTDLNQDAYCRDLYTIVGNGTSVQYSLGTGTPTGVTAVGHTSQGRIDVSWNEVCQGPLYDVYYQVYRNIPPADEKVAVSEWLTSLSFSDTTIEPGVRYGYWVRTATSDQGDNPSDFSNRADTSGTREPVLTISSTAGGSVTTPGEGAFSTSGARITVTAKPTDASLFFFAGWTGSAVDAGKVSHPEQSSTFVTVDGDYTLQAHFATFMDVLYVDDDGPGDPGPRVTITSDPQENGTTLHPFDKIQEAIEVASKGATIVVRSGIYRENIDLLGKNVRVTGLDPGGSAYPVIEGASNGAVVSFTRGEDPNCTLSGFVITAGKDQQAGAINCLRSSPTVVNCVIVGNRASASEGAAIYCQDSEAQFDHLTLGNNICGPQGGAMVVSDSQVTVSNSIVWYNTPRQIALRGNSDLSVTYCSVEGGWSDAGNLDTDPLFADMGHWADPDSPKTEVDPSQPNAIWVTGDYHLRSRTGRWDPQTQTWVQDNVTSPCVDTGDPAAPIGDEPMPHGGITNMGAYGGTAQASLGQ